MRAQQAWQQLAQAEHDAYLARGKFHDAVRELHRGGASLRELASAFHLSRQRVHQIVSKTGARAGWGRPRGPHHESACTFCGHRQSSASMVAGPGVYICPDCAGLAASVLRSGATASTSLGPMAAVPAGNSQQACSFCGKRRDQAAAAAVQTEASPAICSPCLTLCEQMLAERQ